MIGFLHTADPHVATFAGLVRELAPGTPDRHVVDADLLATARAEGPDAVRDGVLAALRRLVGDGAAVVVCTCSTIGGTAESLAAQAGVPVLRVDRPMARLAVAHAAQAQSGTAAVAVVAALASTLGPTRHLLDDEARRAGLHSPAVVDVLAGDAWALFEAGDLAGYHRAVADAVRRTVASAAVAVVLLAQASAAPAADLLGDLGEQGVLVLTSPRSAVRHAADMLPT